MEMRAGEDTNIGQDLTPPISPIALSLHDSSLLSHCSACFSPLTPFFSTNSPHVPTPTFLYCSRHCSSSDYAIPFLSAEHHLLLHLNSSTRQTDTSDIRAALRLLHYFETDGFVSPNDAVFARIGGLMSNREALLCQNDEIAERIKESGKAMAVARRLRDDSPLDLSSGDCVLEEAALCVVLTNAVEVQDNSGRTVGIAVYGTTFSWINHSCSPNACYRFSCSTGESRLHIASAAMDGGGGRCELADNGGRDKCEASRYGWQRYGPRINVRSIKAIKKGEEVTIAYTDLLQPKETRQSDLWQKYRFICRCKRCNVSPLSYVDHVLRDISVVSLNSANPTSNHNFNRDEEVRQLADYIDDAISEYLMFGNAESSCEKLEYVLTHGLIDDQLQGPGKLQQTIIRLQPLHHLAFNAYATLASTYKTLGNEILTSSANLDKHQICAFDRLRISAAYSLLLAGGTHHLFLSESSLVVPVANFWTGAGEAFLSLASSSVWKSSVEQGLSVSKLSPLSHKCALMNKLDADFVSSQAHSSEFEVISREFLNCVKEITPEVWTFMIQGAHYLGVIKDPIDFKWLRNMKDSPLPDFGASSNVERNFWRCEMEGYGNQMRINIRQLGAHCLLYGRFLSRICFSKDLSLAPLSSSIQ